MAKRAFDIFFATAGLVLISPLLAALALGVKLSSRGPVLFRQQRVGKQGRLFNILKFRSMIVNAEELGPSITRDGDSRVTRFGRLLRKTKLDELPQLWNVLIGEMSFVGPRPEVPKYVALYTAEQKRVLALKPGITDLATLHFRHEEELLGTVADPEHYYLKHCIPLKIQLNLAYAQTATVWQDVKIIVRTLLPGALERRKASPQATQGALSHNA